jgi:hypothetical protein
VRDVTDTPTITLREDTPAITVTLRELVAGNARRLRASTHATPDDVVRAARHLGLDWTAAWLQSVERAQKSLTAEQLLALPVVLSAAFGHRVSLADLLTGDAGVLLGKPEGDPVSAARLREVVTASPFRRSFTDLPARSGDSEHRTAARQATEKLRAISRAHLGNVDIRVLNRAELGAGDAETKLARKLGVPPIVVIAAAAELWGRSLTEERDALLKPADDGATPAAAPVLRRLSAAVAQRIADAARAAELADQATQALAAEQADVEQQAALATP